VAHTPPGEGRASPAAPLEARDQAEHPWGRNIRTVLQNLGAVLLVAGAIGCWGGGNETDVPEKIGAFLRAAYADDAPGAAVIVVSRGETVFRKGYGLASLEHRAPITPETVFRLDAVTAQFTAMAILMLEEEGRLSIDDPIADYVPDYPTGETPITVRHLLSHTSGIKNYGTMPEFWERVREDLEPEELLDFFRDEPLEFQPGTRYSYSSSNYILLGLIIERAGGVPYEEFIDTRIFKPLGMERSYYDHYDRVIPNRASGYGRQESGFYNAELVNGRNLYSAAGLLSTADDMARWDAALYTEQLVPKEALERYFTPFTLNDGSPTEYAYGWWTGTLQDKPMLHHYGWVSGFMCKVVRLPQDSVYVAVLSNYPESEPSVFHVADKIAAMAVGEPFEERTAVTLPSDVLERYVGVYRIDGGGVRYVTREGDQLYTQRAGWPKLEARAASETVFFYPHSTSHFEFVLDDSGMVTQMVMHQRGAEEVAVRTDDPLPALPQTIDLDPAVFDRYVGKYEFESGYQLSIFRKVTRQRWEEKKYGLLLPGLRFTVFRDIDRFMAESGYGPMEIFPTSETDFFLADQEAEITFVTGEDGAVEGVLLRSNSGVEEFGRKIR
jgi:D-alanyl-D-alanine carboxypeptidase